MDVTTSRFPVAPEASTFLRTDPAKPPEPTDEAAQPLKNPASSADAEAHGSLKFSLHAADVDVTFETHKATGRMIVTIFDKQTGEVVGELPSRHVLDMIAAFTSNGLHVDTSS